MAPNANFRYPKQDFFGRASYNLSRVCYLPLIFCRTFVYWILVLWFYFFVWVFSLPVSDHLLVLLARLGRTLKKHAENTSLTLSSSTAHTHTHTSIVMNKILVTIFWFLALAMLESRECGAMNSALLRPANLVAAKTRVIFDTLQKWKKLDRPSTQSQVWAQLKNHMNMGPEAQTHNRHTTSFPAEHSIFDLDSILKLPMKVPVFNMAQPVLPRRVSPSSLPSRVYFSSDLWKRLSNHDEAQLSGLKSYTSSSSSRQRLNADTFGREINFLVDRPNPMFWQGPLWSEFLGCCSASQSQARCVVLTERNMGTPSFRDGISALVTSESDSTHDKHSPESSLKETIQALQKVEVDIVSPSDANSSPLEHKLLRLMEKIRSIQNALDYPLSTPYAVSYFDSDLMTLDYITENVQKLVYDMSLGQITLKLEYSGYMNFYGPWFTRIIQPKGLSTINHLPEQHENFADVTEKLLELCKHSKIVLNTSNKYKIADYREWFPNLQATGLDLQEPDADPITVIRYKASQFDDGVLVEDSSLDVEGENVGVNIKWMCSHMERFINKRARSVSLLAYKKGNRIHIFRGEVSGKIVAKDGKCSSKGGFDPIFLPDGATKTLYDAKPLQYNARWYSTAKFIMGQSDAVADILPVWPGKMQNE